MIISIFIRIFYFSSEKLNIIFNIYRYPYAAVAELIYGNKMRIFVNILLNMTVFGSGVPNILVGLYL